MMEGVWWKYFEAGQAGCTGGEYGIELFERVKPWEGSKRWCWGLF